MGDRKIALVTGANKGVGYGIIRQLVLQASAPMLIYMTSRDKSRGQDALSKIKDESDLKSKLSDHEIKWIQLDVLDPASIKEVRDFVVKEHGQTGLDILINNAGIATKGDTFNREIVDTTLKTNYYATLNMCDAFVPIIKPGGRLVNVSSMASKLGRLSPELQKRFRDPQLTVDGASALMEEFAEGVKDSSPPEGWPKAGYSVSKMGVTAMTKALARSHPDILVNCVCPGWVRTDMAGQNAAKSIDEGAMTPVHVAIGDIGRTTGEFWEDSAISTW